MQKHEERLITISANITESQTQKIKDLMMVLGLNRSEVIREAIDLMAEIHTFDLSEQKAKES